MNVCKSDRHYWFDNYWNIYVLFDDKSVNIKTARHSAEQN